MLPSHDASPLLDGAVTGLDHSDPSWLQKIRSQAFGQLSSNGLPTRRHEEWKYTNLKTLLNPEYLINKVDNELGRFAVSGLPTDGSVTVATHKAGDLPESVRTLLESKNGKEHATAQLNLALCSELTLITIAPETSVKGLVVDTNVLAGSNFSQLIIQVGAGSSVSMQLNARTTASEASYQNCMTLVDLAANSKIRIVHATHSNSQSAMTNTVCAEIGSHASFEHLNVAKGCKLGRQDITTNLSSEGSHCTLDGLYLLSEGEHLDNHTVIDHRVPLATSKQYYKGILKGKSRAVFSGKIFVRPKAQKTSAEQLNKNLMLSPESEIDTKPQLEIEADDVKCSHGATIGRLNDDEMFYLESRGISPTDAKRMLSKAFADDLLNQWTEDDCTIVRSMVDAYFAN